MPLQATLLQSVAPPQLGDVSENPYVTMMESSLGEHFAVRRFSWSVAFGGDSDAFLIHWPEFLLGGASGFRRHVAALKVVVLAFILLMRDITVIRIMHNEKAHERSTILGRIALQLLDRATTLRISLHDEVKKYRRGQTVLLPHGTYEPWFVDTPRCESRPGKLIFFGQLRPYKGLENLLASFEAIDDPSLSLSVVGQPKAQHLLTVLEMASQRDDRIVVRAAHCSDAELAQHVTSAEVTILPHPTLYNSGSLLLALSLGRPVIAPASPAVDQLQAEVGADWVQTFVAPLTAAKLANALRAVRESDRSAAPVFQHRDWAGQASQLHTLFLETVQARSTLRWRLFGRGRRNEAVS